MRGRSVGKVWNATATVAALLGTCSGAAAQDVGTPDLRPTARPWRLDAIYKADALYSHAEPVHTAVDFLDVTLNLDAATLLDWPRTTIRLEGLLTHGGKPNRSIGSIGGLSNLEVTENSGRLYAFWVAHDFADGLSGLFGLYDLNSEFYSTDASALLVHPTFGIGTEFAQTGRNGPSIFPNLSLGLRLRAQNGDGYYAQAAALDGVPGDPLHPGRTVVRLGSSDGALLVAEAGRQQADTGRHWGIGLWSYTRSAERIDANGRRQNRGAYALGQMVLIDGPVARTSGFLRFGVATSAVNDIDRAAEAGILVQRPFGMRGPDALTAGVTTARLGKVKRARDDQSGLGDAPAETAVELGVRWRSGNFAVQPLMQRLWGIGGRRGATATMLGVHVEWQLRSNAP